MKESFRKYIKNLKENTGWNDKIVASEKTT